MQNHEHKSQLSWAINLSSVQVRLLIQSYAIKPENLPFDLMAFCDSVSVGNTDFYKYLLWLAGWWRVHEKLPEQFLPPALG